jgi:electron transfer flavoprotein alpha subunit
MPTQSTLTVYTLALWSAEELRMQLAEENLVAALQIAQQLKLKSHAIIVGQTTSETQVFCESQGFDYVTTCTTDDQWPAYPQTHQFVDLIETILIKIMPAQAQTEALFIAGASDFYEELFARLATRLQSKPLGRCERIKGGSAQELEIEKSSFGGRLRTVWQYKQGPYFISTRVKQAAKPELIKQTAPRASVHDFVSIPTPARLRKPFEIQTAELAQEFASVEGAKILISGGRGVSNEANFNVLYSIANSLGGAVSASLPAVDAGWAPVARQVGQSGRYVRPDVYLAVGISGTPQHMAGIDPGSRIFAINKDPEANIFAFAELGVVADCTELLPALFSELRNTCPLTKT